MPKQRNADVNTSDVKRGLIGTLLNGYNEDHVRPELKATIERFRRAEVVRIDQSAAFASVDLADHAPTPDVVAMDRSELHRVAEVMQEMPPRMREAIYLRRIEGLRPAQVAERMNISVSTVETHIKRALRLLVSGLAQPATQRKAEQTPQWEQAETI